MIDFFTMNHHDQINPFTHPSPTQPRCEVNDEDRFALLVVDSIMGGFRVDYSGRGELADRQQKLAKVLTKLQKISEDGSARPTRSAR